MACKRAGGRWQDREQELEHPAGRLAHPPPLRQPHGAAPPGGHGPACPDCLRLPAAVRQAAQRPASKVQSQELGGQQGRGGLQLSEAVGHESKRAACAAGWTGRSTQHAQRAGPGAARGTQRSRPPVDKGPDRPRECSLPPPSQRRRTFLPPNRRPMSRPKKNKPSMLAARWPKSLRAERGRGHSTSSGHACSSAGTRVGAVELRQL